MLKSEKAHKNLLWALGRTIQYNLYKLVLPMVTSPRAEPITREDAECATLFIL
jgi:hypothetical protein